MSKLDEVLKALNKMLGNSAVQRASELVKSVEVLLNEDENHGEHIPPQNQTAKPRPDPRKKTAAPSFFAHDRGVSGGYTPPKPVDPLSQPRYQPIDVRRNAEPLFRREYRELRRAGENYSLYRSAPSELAKRFYAQARLVQRYADQYEQSEPCVNLYVSYMDLSVRQFRTYVTMHPQLLRGDYSRITPDGWSYLALYFSELLCGAAKAELPDEERLAELTDIAAYAGGLPFESEHDAKRVKGYFEGWLYDYALTRQNLKAMRQYAFAANRGVMLDSGCDEAAEAYHRQDYAALMECFSRLCPYHICTTAVCKKAPYDKIYPKLFEAVLAALEEHFRGSKTMEERLFDRMFAVPYPAFEHLEARISDVDSFVLDVSPWKQYRFDSKSGRYETLTRMHPNTDWIAAVFRCMDYFFRLEVGTVKLKSSGMDSITQEKVIARAVHAFCEQHHLIGWEQKRKQKAKEQAKKEASQPKPVRMELDLSKLVDIRKDSGEVEARLLSVYENREPSSDLAADIPPMAPASERQTPAEHPDKKEPAVFKENTADAPENTPPQYKSVSSSLDPEWEELSALLDERQTAYLALLSRSPDEAAAYLSDWYRSVGTLPQLLLEQINALALETVGDTLMETEGEIRIYEDYIDSVQEITKR